MPTKILAIDDSKTMRLAIKITFAAEDTEVIAVSKGSEAVARAKKMGAEIVLVDHALAAGEPSGFDVVRALKSDPATSGTPVVLMVPSSGTVGEDKISACGADGSLSKPFETQGLIDLVATTIAGGARAKPAASPRAAAPPTSKPAVPPMAPAASKPAVPPMAPAASKPVAPPMASKPAVPPAASKPVARPPAPVAKSPVPAAKPISKPVPAAAVAAAPQHPATSASPGAVAIPIAIPIPFTSAASPTAGMLARLQKANGAAVAGLDPRAVEALLSLSREVVEQVVWEVVPELAEHIIKEKAQQV